MVGVTTDHGEVRAVTLPGGSGGAAEGAILVAVEQVAGGINLLVAVHLEKVIAWAAGGGAGDEVIVEDVLGEDAAGIGDGVAALVIIDNIIDEDRVNLGERVAVVPAGKNIVAPGEGVVHRLGVGVELLADGIGEDGILDGDLVGADVAVGIEIIVRSEFERDVVEDHVGAVAAVDGVLGGTGDGAGTDAEEADDFVGAGAEGNFVAHEADAFAGGGLAGDGEVVGAGDGAVENDVAADIEDDGAVALADGIAEGAGAGIAEAGDVIDGAAASAGGEGAETFCAGEGGGLGVSGGEKEERG